MNNLKRLYKLTFHLKREKSTLVHSVNAVAVDIDDAITKCRQHSPQLSDALVVDVETIDIVEIC